MEPKIISSIDISDLADKFTPSYCHGKNDTAVQEEMIKDCYLWASKNNHSIISITCFYCANWAANLVIAYE